MENQPTFSPTNVLELPARTDPLDKVIDAMIQVESSGRSGVSGKRGERGLMQIMPQTGLMYGVTPDKLFDPTINRAVGKRYLSDLLKKYKSIPMALAAYNAGPHNVDKGIIPPSTRDYLRKILEAVGGGVSKAIGEGTAYGEDEYKGPEKALTEKEYKGPEIPLKGTAPAKPLPFAVRAADWAPLVGQSVGETVLGSLGAASPIPGGAYGGAVVGSGLGAAGGAEVSNLVRRGYGLPETMSPWKEGAESAAFTGALKPFEALKGLKVAKSAEGAFEKSRTAFEGVMGELEKMLGMGEGKARILAKAGSSAPVRASYDAARDAGYKKLGQAYETLLQPFGHRMTPNRAAAAMKRVGPYLDAIGKPLRQELENAASTMGRPMTVRREQLLIQNIRALKRAVNPVEGRGVLGALNEIERAAKEDIRGAIGATASRDLDTLDSYYARHVATYPAKIVKGVKGAYSMGESAEQLIKGDPQRTMRVLQEIKASGGIEEVRKGVSARIFQKVGSGGVKEPAAKIESIQKAIEGIDSGVFDELYGTGAKERWLKTSDGLLQAHDSMLRYPDRARAISGEVQKYLKQPGTLKSASRFLGHHLMFEAIAIGAGYGAGYGEISALAGVLFGIGMLRRMADSPMAMSLYEKAVTTQDGVMAGRFLAAAINALVSEGAKSAEIPVPIRGADAAHG